MVQPSPLIAATGFDLLEPTLAKDIESALASALAAGVVFRSGEKPLGVFRELVGEAIRDIGHHPRGQLFQRFLTRGPYWAPGPIPPQDVEKCLTDPEVSAAISFIYSFMVNTFQGCLAEILALPPCLEIVRDLRSRRDLSPQARLYAGDSVQVTSPSGLGRAKGADLHILSETQVTGPSAGATVWGVVEVKSYSRPLKHLLAQLSSHLTSAERGLRVQGMNCPSERVAVGAKPVQIAVVPAGWHLPRTFRFVEENGRKMLRTEAAIPPTKGPVIVPLTDHAWHVTLRWSQEALAAAAYELTFWYMAKVGEVIYAGGVPSEWQPMTPAEAGQNAAKMMLYYAILRARRPPEEQRAIALYNAYGFGYALGTSFRNPRRSREMLWPEDLEEILAHGETKHGCRLMPRKSARAGQGPVR